MSQKRIDKPKSPRIAPLESPRAPQQHHHQAQHGERVSSCRTPSPQRSFYESTHLVRVGQSMPSKQGLGSRATGRERFLITGNHRSDLWSEV